MPEKIKIGLVGAGIFAGYHANKLAAHRRVQFIGVHDPDAARATVLAQKHKIEAMELESLLKASDALVIACPASFHGIQGQSQRVKSNAPDMAYAILTYGDSKARLSASRVAEASERWMRLIYPSGEIRIDFNAKTLTNAAGFDLNMDFAQNPIAKDSLGAATNVFIQAVLDDTPVLVSAEDGTIAVKVAAAIDQGRR